MPVTPGIPGLQVERRRQIARLMHETEDDRRLCFSVVNQKIRKAAQGPKPIPLRSQL